MVQWGAMITRAAILLLALLLAACAGGGPPKRVNPPAASLQEIAVQADGSWRVLLRVQSFSTFGQSFQNIELDLVVDGARAGMLRPETPREVPGRAAEVFHVLLVPEADAARELKRFDESGRPSFIWNLSGRITVDGRHYRNDFEGRLSRVPGLPNTYR
jgi:hypothetical protein